jgi:acyl-CoA synthetase (AMP-forming)/AMP-acid ligase II/pyrroloquinoline quinone (PQQ) biosynthesis protein C
MMTARFFASLAARPAADIALHDDQQAMRYGELLQAVDSMAARLRAEGVRVLATQLDNGLDWALVDLAALRAGIVHVPLPAFFTPAQRQHAVCAAGADALLTVAASAAEVTPGLGVSGTRLRLAHVGSPDVPLQPGTAKVTFTSGTTGTPKGVCLSAHGMLAVAEGLALALQPLGIRRHLCALPLPVLLENIAGLYAPLFAGATAVVLPQAQTGLDGSSRFDPLPLQRAVERHESDSVIVLPQMLRLWAGWRQSNATSLPKQGTLKLVAVGGAAVGEAAIAFARAVGLPAYEGYGLSEAGSVQTLNLPGADRPGSAGRALPHAQLRVGADGEIEVGGALMQGYVGGAARSGPWWPTGDLGCIDADGFVHVTGRRKNVLITGYGRNVSPEWVETALQSQPEIAVATVFGDGEPALWAVLWPSDLGSTDNAIERAVARANACLPDYARIARWVRAALPFTVATGLATPNGRAQRAAVLAHGRALLACHESSLSLVELNPMQPNDTAEPVFARLRRETAADRQRLIGAPIIQAALAGRVSLPSYLAFLSEAYHHVRHTVPLLRACRDRLPARLDWMRPALDEYIAEEAGHDAWILDDIAAAGGDAEAVRNGAAAPATEVMVAYAYDTIARRNPVSFLGMVHVLEGTSVDLALAAADRIQAGLGLPDNAFSYLRSHGTLDREHTAHFEQLVNALDDAQDREALIHAARMFYALYGDLFRSLPMPQVAPQAATALPEAA